MISLKRCFQAAALASLILAAGACRSQKTRPTYSAVPCDKPMAQGVHGQIEWAEGNQMPGPVDPSRPAPRPKPKGVKRQVLVYAPQNMNTLKGDGGGFFDKPATAPLLKLDSNDQGCFKAQLPAGKYSLFVNEEGRLYANIFDGEGVIFPVEVRQGQVSTVSFPINYKAVY